MAGKAKKRAKPDKKRERRSAKGAGKSAGKGSKLDLAHPIALFADALGGAKVPGALRRSGSALAEFATSEVGRAMLAAALTGAAEALLRHRPAGADAAAAPTAKNVLQGVLQEAAVTAVGAAKEAAKTVLPPALVGEAGPPDAERPKKGRAADAERDGAKA